MNILQLERKSRVVTKYPTRLQMPAPACSPLDTEPLTATRIPTGCPSNAGIRLDGTVMNIWPELVTFSASVASRRKFGKEDSPTSRISTVNDSAPIRGCTDDGDQVIKSTSFVSTSRPSSFSLLKSTPLISSGLTGSKSNGTINYIPFYTHSSAMLYVTMYGDTMHALCALNGNNAQWINQASVTPEMNVAPPWTVPSLITSSTDTWPSGRKGVTHRTSDELLT